MRILVTVAAESVLGDEFEIDGGIDDRYLSRALTEWDAAAIAAAERIREARDGVEVVTATVGPSDTEPVIREALANGPDRAVRVWDDRVAEAGRLDPAATARLLAGVVADLDPDLVLTGAQSADDGFAATGVTLADRLDFGWAAAVTAVELDRESGVVSVRRELEGNVAELTEVELPAVLTVQSGTTGSRYRELGDVRAAQDAAIPVYTLDDLDLTAADIESPLGLVGLAEPERERDLTLFDGATELASLLRERGVGQ